MFFGSLNSSIGNLNADSDTEKKYSVFKTVSFLSFWVFSIVCIGVFFVGEDMIRMVSGQLKFVLGKEILIASILVFYLLRNRICSDGSEWLKPEMKEFMSQRLYDDNKEYSFAKKNTTNLKFYTNKIKRKLLKNFKNDN